MADVLRN